MKHYWKRRIKHLLHTTTHTLRKWKYYHMVQRLPFLFRVALSIVFFVYGVIALFTPLPFGIFSILGAGVLVMGARRIRSYLLRFFAYIQLYKIIGCIHHWWIR